ncbi:MAG: hypothetical protein ACOYN4_09350 [Bacteroidales bacterium]
MKILATTFFMVLAINYFAKAQDVITLNSGQEIKAHIVKLYPKEVTYTTNANLDTLSFQRSEISTLRYSTGILIYLNEMQRPEFAAEPINDSLYLLGQTDANLYYTGYKPAATGTLITSFFVPWGLIPAFACSSTTPSMQNLGFRNQTLIQNPSYYKGYTDNAYKIKKKKVWRNFAIGSGVTVGLYIISIAAMSALYVM